MLVISWGRAIACQCFSVSRVGFHPLTPVTADYPMYHISMDTAGPFTQSARGMVHLLIVVCLFTRFCFLRALPNKEAATIAAVLFAIFCEVGFPSIIQSDNDTEFANSVIAELVKLMMAVHHFSTPYNPRANGLA